MKQTFKTKREELQYSCGQERRHKFILACLGYNGYKGYISRGTSEEIARVVEIVRGTPVEKKIHKEWEGISDAETHFGMALFQHIDKLKSGGALKLIKNLDGILVPIIHMETASKLLGVLPVFTDTYELKHKYKFERDESNIKNALRKKGVPEHKFTRWNNCHGCSFDKKLSISCWKEIVKLEQQKEKAKEAKKKEKPTLLEHEVTPAARIDKKRMKIYHAAGPKKHRPFIVAQLGFKGYANFISRGKEKELDRIIRIIDKLPVELDIPSGWETLSSAETHFGKPLSRHVNRLKKNKAFKLVLNFDKVITPIVHTEKTSEILGIKPHFTDAFELEHVHNFPYYHICKKYLREAGIKDKKFTRWDFQKICVFDANLAIPYLQELMEMTCRPGKKNGGLLNKKKPTSKIGGWKAVIGDEKGHSWREKARIYRESHPQQD